MLTKLNDNYSIDENTGELHYQGGSLDIFTKLRGDNALELCLARDQGFTDGIEYGYMLMQNFLSIGPPKAKTED